MLKVTLFITLILLLILFVKCTSPHNYPKNHLQFYDNRYYPIPQTDKLPPAKNHTYLILYGTHFNAKGDTTYKQKGRFFDSKGQAVRKHPFINGAEPFEGFFFMDVDAKEPQLTHWQYQKTGTNYYLDRPFLTYGGRRIYLQEDGTFGAMFKPHAPKPEGKTSSYLASSQDGEWHVFQWSPYGSTGSKMYELHLQKIDGRVFRSLLKTPDYVSNVLFAPDNQHLLFNGTTNLLVKDKDVSKEYVLRWMNINDSTSTYREIYRDTLSYQPFVFLDSSTVLLGREHQLLTMNIESGELKVFYETEAVQKVVENEDGSKTYHSIPQFQEIKLSPDGKKIAFKYKHSLWCINSDGTNARQIASPYRRGGFLNRNSYCWLSDSKRLVFRASKEGEDLIKHSKYWGFMASEATNDRLYLVDIEGKEVQELTFKHINMELVGAFEL